MSAEQQLAAQLRQQGRALTLTAERLVTVRLPRFDDHEWQGLGRWAFDQVQASLYRARADALVQVRDAAAHSARAAETLEMRVHGGG